MNIKLPDEFAGQLFLIVGGETTLPRDKLQWKYTGLYPPTVSLKPWSIDALTEEIVAEYVPLFSSEKSLQPSEWTTLVLPLGQNSMHPPRIYQEHWQEPVWSYVGPFLDGVCCNLSFFSGRKMECVGCMHQHGQYLHHNVARRPWTAAAEGCPDTRHNSFIYFWWTEGDCWIFFLYINLLQSVARFVTSNVLHKSIITCFLALLSLACCTPAVYPVATMKQLISH